MSDPELTIAELRESLQEDASLNFLSNEECRGALGYLLGRAQGNERAHLLLAAAVHCELSTRPDGYAGDRLAERMEVLR